MNNVYLLVNGMHLLENQLLSLWIKDKVEQFQGFISRLHQAISNIIMPTSLLPFLEQPIIINIRSTFLGANLVGRGQIMANLSNPYPYIHDPQPVPM